MSSLSCADSPGAQDLLPRITPGWATPGFVHVPVPGAGLVDETVARTIVEFVSGSRGGSAERLAELTVEPPQLSVR